MSSGEAKRILIARALVHDPKTLIFDEPSNSLDVFAQHSLREIMHTLARSGTGVVLVTHHISDIIPEIERVVLMRGGRILADGRKKKCWRRRGWRSYSEYTWTSRGAMATSIYGEFLAEIIRRSGGGWGEFDLFGGAS